MSLSPRLKWAAVALLLAVAALLSTSLRFGSDRSSESYDLHATDISAEIEDPVGLTSDAQPTRPAGVAEDESSTCLTLTQLEGHPVLVNDTYRFDAVSDSGPAIASYRGLSEQELQGLTEQGDSAAMAVLGGMSVMRARDWPIEKAVSYLMAEDPELMTYTFTRPIPPEFINHMKQARSWFYKAALHGRIMVLHRVGESLSLEQGGPVELGWISKQEYGNLSSYEKAALDPANVYNVLAYEIAPGLRSGPIGGILSELMPRTEQQKVIVDQLAEQFDRDLQDDGLPPIVVSESTAPPIDDLLSLLCERERDWLERHRENDR